MKKHDESNDIKRISRVAFVDYSTKTIKVRDKSHVGIKSWGRIDFLVKHCDYSMVYDKTAFVDTEDHKSYRETKKEIKKDAKLKKFNEKNINKFKDSKKK